MKKFFIFLVPFLIINLSFASAETIDCILIKQGNKTLIKEGKGCNEYYSPNSSFKIPLAVIGFESKILKDRHNPVWKPQKPVTFLKYYHDSEQSPSSWMRFSVVWYSQILTQKLGMKKFQMYVDKFNYGNRNLSGDIGKNNGLNEAWLSSSLKITPIEQIEFIEKLAKNELPVSKKSQEQAKDLIKLMEESNWCNWWSIHGKTGSSDFDKSNHREGYFVGFGEKNGEIISFVIHVSGKVGNKSEKVGGIEAKKILMNKMIKEGIFN